MKTFRRLVSFLLISALLSFATVKPSQHEFKPKQHASVHSITMENDEGTAGCTATAIAPHVLLTAAHCDLENSLLTVDDEENTQLVVEKVFDGNDHMLLVVPGENFTNYVKYNPNTYKPPMQEEHVYFWGDPEGRRDMYREGVVMGYSKVEIEDLEVADKAYFIQMTSAHGDSGSAIFAEDGRLVSVVTAGNQVTTIAFPLKFTYGQVAQAEHVK